MSQYVFTATAKTAHEVCNILESSVHRGLGSILREQIPDTLTGSEHAGMDERNEHPHRHDSTCPTCDYPERVTPNGARAIAEQAAEHALSEVTGALKTIAEQHRGIARIAREHGKDGDDHMIVSMALESTADEIEKRKNR